MVSIPPIDSGDHYIDAILIDGLSLWARLPVHSLTAAPEDVGRRLGCPVKAHCIAVHLLEAVAAAIKLIGTIRIAQAW
jgi:hypothetical protein